MNFKTTAQLPKDIEETFLEFEKCQTIQKTITMSNSRYHTTVVDSNGIISNIKVRNIPRDTLVSLGLSTTFRGVIIIETRYLHYPNDYKDTLNYYRESMGKVKYTELANSANDMFINNNPKDLKKYYALFTIHDDDLRLDESIFLRASNLVVSIKGKEKPSPLTTFLDLGELVSLSNEVSVKIYYYSKEKKTIYYNMFGQTYKLDSEESEVHDEGVLVVYNNNAILTNTHIPESSFLDSNIYFSPLEAKYNMNKEMIVNDKKVDLDMQKVETGFLLETMKKETELKKIRLEMLDKILKMRLEMLKQSNNNVLLNTGLKIFTDFISVILKKI